MVVLVLWDQSIPLGCIYLSFFYSSLHPSSNKLFSPKVWMLKGSKNKIEKENIWSSIIVLLNESEICTYTCTFISFNKSTGVWKHNIYFLFGSTHGKVDAGLFSAKYKFCVQNSEILQSCSVFVFVSQSFTIWNLNIKQVNKQIDPWIQRINWWLQEGSGVGGMGKMSEVEWEVHVSSYGMNKSHW